MNILICGRQGGLCRQLAERLSREKGEIYYISGNKSDEKLSKSVFQEYYFPYLNENINQIILGTRPEIMIVAGAADSNFSWRNPEKDATEFVTCMTSLFMAAQNAGVKELVYVSSTEIFENNKEESIDIKTQPSADSVRLRAFVRTEKLLEDFRNLDNSPDSMQIRILRLPPVFGDYSDGSNEFCLRTATDYIQSGTIHIFSSLVHTGIFFRDAAEAVIRCAMKKEGEALPLYQVKGLVFTEEELANALLQTGWNKGAYIERSTSEDEASIRMDCPPSRIAPESEISLGLRLRYNLQSACDLLCKECLRRRKEVQKAERSTVQILPVIESVVFALIAYFVTVWLSGTWVGDNLNFFIIYVLTLAVVYGTSHGLFASILGGTGLLFVMMQEDSFLDVVTDYSFYLRFLQLIIVGVIAGYIRDRYARQNKGLTEERNYLTTELSEVTRINDNNVYVKNIYEKRLVGYENSLSRIYELTSRLDYMESQKVTFQAVHMISELMEMKDVAIYTASRRSKFMRLAAYTSDLALSCGKSLKFDVDTFLYDDLANKRIYTNKNLAEKKPTFGGAVYSGDQLLSVILVWTDDLRQVNLYASDTLAIACKLVEKSMARAFLYEESLRNDTYVGGTNIMKPDAFLKMLDIYEDGRKQGLLTFTVLRILLNGHTLEEAAKFVRETDYVGIINNIVTVILSNSTMEDAQFVLKRYASKGMEAVPVNPQMVIDDAARIEQKTQEAQQ